jgi:hypothetical protein
MCTNGNYEPQAKIKKQVKNERAQKVSDFAVTK